MTSENTQVIRWTIEGLKPVSINEVAGGHWMKRHRLLTPWKSVAMDAALLFAPLDCRNKLTTVRVSIPFKTNRRRDPHNYTGTVVKSIVDGFVLAGVWPDDTAEWVTVLDPELRIDKSEDAVVMVYLTHGVSLAGGTSG
jgi:hypothetical protein